MAIFSLRYYDRIQRRIVLSNPSFDFDDYPQLGQALLKLLSAKLIEQQSDADLHTWLIDFEGCQLLLKAEHYSETMWIEGLSHPDERDVLDYLANLFKQTISY